MPRVSNTYEAHVDLRDQAVESVSEGLGYDPFSPPTFDAFLSGADLVIGELGSGEPIAVLVWTTAGHVRLQDLENLANDVDSFRRGIASGTVAESAGPRRRADALWEAVLKMCDGHRVEGLVGGQEFPFGLRDAATARGLGVIEVRP
jgi:hypothetical protein